MRRLSAILLLLAANQLFAQGGPYAEISSVSVDTTSQRRVTINWDVAEVVNGQAFAIYHWENDKWVLIVDSLPADMRSYQDVKAHPFEHAERYSISTSIPGNPNAPLSEWHQTVFLSSGDYDKCHKSLTLYWLKYDGGSVADYTIVGRQGSNHTKNWAQQPKHPSPPKNLCQEQNTILWLLQTCRTAKNHSQT